MGEEQAIEPSGSARACAHPDLFAFEAEQGLRRRMPALSASTVITGAQMLSLAGAAAACIALAVFSPGIAFAVLVALSSVSFVVGTGFRGVLSFIGGGDTRRRDLEIADDDLPTYTVLVPLYREANVVASLARALAQLTYPSSKLDIKIIVEADDPETEAAARTLEGPFQLIRVPAGQPKTKPRACGAMLSGLPERCEASDAVRFSSFSLFPPSLEFPPEFALGT